MTDIEQILIPNPYPNPFPSCLELKASGLDSGSSPALIRAVAAKKGPRIGPGGRKMVKSFSQDAQVPGSTLVKNAAVAMLMASEQSTSMMHSSASDSHLSSHIDNAASTSPHNVLFDSQTTWVLYFSLANFVFLQKMKQNFLKNLT